jgi:hypothetical protein
MTVPWDLDSKLVARMMATWFGKERPFTYPDLKGWLERSS